MGNPGSLCMHGFINKLCPVPGCLHYDQEFQDLLARRAAMEKPRRGQAAYCEECWTKLSSDSWPHDEPIVLCAPCWNVHINMGFHQVKGPETDGGKKNDDGKLRYDLIPTYPLEELARVYTIGAGKYADHNWRQGFRWGRIFSALMRHAWAWWRGERNDPQDGQHHLASVAWTAFALMEFEKTGTGEDDRWKR